VPLDARPFCCVALRCVYVTYPRLLTTTTTYLLSHLHVGDDIVEAGDDGVAAEDELEDFVLALGVGRVEDLPYVVVVLCFLVVRTRRRVLGKEDV